MSSDAERGANYPIRAVERVCDVLDVLQQSAEGASFSTVAEKTGLPKSSAYRYLTALETRQYVARDESGLYRLGLAFRPRQTRELELLVDLSRPKLERLRDLTGETTNLGLLDGTDVVHAVVVESPHMMRLAARPGDRGPLHATALGKAIAARLSEERVRAILAATGLAPLTGRTITSTEDYLYELERVRRLSYGVDDCENQPDGRCVAVALDGLPLLSGISVSAPANRLAAERVAEVAGQLRAVATELVEEYLARTTHTW